MQLTKPNQSPLARSAVAAVLQADHLCLLSIKGEKHCKTMIAYWVWENIFATVCYSWRGVSNPIPRWVISYWNDNRTDQTILLIHRRDRSFISITETPLFSAKLVLSNHHILDMVSLALLRSALLCLRGSRTKRRIHVELSDIDFDIEKGHANIR